MRHLKNLLLMLGFAVLMAACAPAEASQPPTTEVSTSPAATSTETKSQSPTATLSPEPAAEIPPQAVPTSRGDALVATDPALVNFNTGKPVLVEFFRFT